MDISFDCPRCNQHLAVDAAGAGMTVNCPSCNEQIEIPRAAVPPAPKLSVSREADVPVDLPPPPQPPAVLLNPKPEQVTYDASTNTFRGTMPQVMKLAMRAVQELRWTLVNVNDTLGLVTFETGMTLMTLGSMSGVSGSLTIMELSENQFRVSGTGKQNVRGGQILALDLGGAQRKLDQVLNKMRELAQPPPDPATLAAEAKTSPHSSGRFIVAAIGLLAAGLLLFAVFNHKLELIESREATLTTTIYPQDGSGALPAGTKVEVLSHSDATARIRYSGRELVVSMDVLKQSK